MYGPIGKDGARTMHGPFFVFQCRERLVIRLPRWQRLTITFVSLNPDTYIITMPGSDEGKAEGEAAWAKDGAKFTRFVYSDRTISGQSHG